MVESTHNDERYGVEMLDLVLRTMLHVSGMLDCSEGASLVDMVAKVDTTVSSHSSFISNLPNDQFV